MYIQAFVPVRGNFLLWLAAEVVIVELVSLISCSPMCTVFCGEIVTKKRMVVAATPGLTATAGTQTMTHW